MSFSDRLRAAEAERREHLAQRDEHQRRSEEETLKHARAAEALLPELDEAVATLRSRQDASVAALRAESSRPRNIQLRWAGENRLAGWEVAVSMRFNEIGQVRVLIPVDGEPKVESEAPSASGPLRQYVRGGRWFWSDESSHRRETAHRTMETLLDTIAEHLAELSGEGGIRTHEAG
jgi:hypothetical protein